MGHKPGLHLADILYWDTFFEVNQMAHAVSAQYYRRKRKHLLVPKMDGFLSNYER